MPAKRKRSYSRRYTKRRRVGASAASVAKQMAKILQDHPGYGDPNSEQFKRYGPSRKQMIDHPGTKRTAAQTQARLIDNYRGPGDYMQAGEMIGGGLGAFAGGLAGTGLFPGAGTTAGAAAGGAIGAGIGGGIGHAIDVYTGHGDYKSVNQIAGGGDVISVNKLNRTGDIFISQTEYIGNLVASVANDTAGVTKMSEFELRSYDINPSNDSLFPFLSQIAQNYEMYEWNGLMIKYTPNSGETSTSSNQLGKVMAATNYDPECRDFVNSIEMLNYDYSNSCKPSNVLVHGVETAINARAPRMLYVAEPHEAKDKVFTDIGKLYIATEGIPVEQNDATGNTSVVLGELHVSYSIRLSRAKLYGALLGYDIEADRVLHWTTATTGGEPLLGSVAGTLDLAKLKAGTQTWDKTSLKAYHPDAEYWQYNSNTWAIICETDGNTTPIFTFWFIHKEKHVPMGTYRWKIVIDANSSVTMSGNSSNIKDAVNVKAIKQTIRSGNARDTAEVLFVEGEDTTTTPLTFVATGFVEISGNDPRPPQFSYALGQFSGNAPSYIITKVTIEQVSSHVKDAVF